MTTNDEKQAIAKLSEAIREYHEAFGKTMAPDDSMPMNWVVVYSATSIDEDNEIVWGNHVAMSPGDPNVHSGLTNWASVMVGPSTENYDDD